MAVFGGMIIGFFCLVVFQLVLVLRSQEKIYQYLTDERSERGRYERESGGNSSDNNVMPGE